MSLQEAAALAGVILGTFGSVLGVLNYLRDRSKVTVTLQWDMAITQNPIYDPRKKWGVITIANVGRRPVYITQVLLRFPPGSKEQVLLLRDAVAGQKLTEGDAPKSYMSDQEDLRGYTKEWKKVFAEVYDSRGKKWRSRHQRWQTEPSWTKP